MTIHLELHLDLMTREQLVGFLDSICTERMLQLADSIDGIAKQFLSVCDAEKTKVLLSKIISNKNSARDGYRKYCDAFKIMNSLDRLPVFVDAVKLSRESFYDRIDVVVLANDEFLPKHIKKVVEIENRVYFYKRNRLGEQRMIAEKCDIELDKLLKGVKAQVVSEELE